MRVSVHISTQSNNRTICPVQSPHRGLHSIHRLISSLSPSGQENDMSKYYDDDGDDDTIHFADPCGRSALRAASKNNPRNLPCPACRRPNRLTPADAAAGYQCNSCADHDEGMMGGSFADY